MTNQVARIDWAWLVGAVPQDLSGLAKQTGAVARWRKVCSGEVLLWLCMLYTTTALSLRSTSFLSQSTGRCKLNDSSLLHRLRAAGPFLQAVLNHVLFRSAAGAKGRGLRRVLRLQDATVLCVPGSSGADFRLHTVYVPGLGLTSVEITDGSGGEGLHRGHYEPNDIVVADQGLAHARSIHHVHRQGAFTLVRAYLQNIRLHDIEAKRLELGEVLQQADRGQRSRAVLVPLDGCESVKARLIVTPLPAEQAARARQRLHKRAGKKQKTLSEQALRLAGYFVVLTTVDEAVLSDEQVVKVYRLRWQIELFFKRCKSILMLSSLAADDPELVTTFCLGKMIEAALIDRLNNRMVELSGAQPDDALRPSVSLYRLTVVHHLQMLLAVCAGFRVKAERLLCAIGALREGRRKRGDSLSLIMQTHRRINQPRFEPHLPAG